MLYQARSPEQILDELEKIRSTDSWAPTFTETVDAGIPVYAVEVFRTATRARLARELASCLIDGPGVYAIRGAIEQDVVQRVTDAFFAIVDDERSSKTTSGDHFAKPGANDRVWNALEKVAVIDPDAFCDYYESDVIALASESWLGPWYQVTSQVNVVNPGGEAQKPHRDYHLGFMTDEDGGRFPRHAQLVSPMLTLQGAVAHCDMPVATGPTMYLPHSHKLVDGYLAWRMGPVAAYFGDHHVSLELRTGDAVFFNPALFHGAGTNRTGDVRRIANLLQVSSAMGRAMESVDRGRICRSIFGALSSRRDDGWDERRIARVVAASAEGYPFPTNLDHDQPVGRLTPESQAELVRRALDERWAIDEFSEALSDHERRRSTV